MCVCSNCRSIHLQAKVWYNMNQNSVDWEGSLDLEEYYCEDCDTKEETYTITNIKTVNGAVKVAGYQVLDDEGNIHPDMVNEKALYSLDQANDMINSETDGTDCIDWELRAVYHHDFEGQVKMFEGKDPRKS